MPDRHSVLTVTASSLAAMLLAMLVVSSETRPGTPIPGVGAAECRPSILIGFVQLW